MSLHKCGNQIYVNGKLVEPGCMGTPAALLHMELVGSLEYLPSSEIIYGEGSDMRRPISKELFINDVITGRGGGGLVKG